MKGKWGTFLLMFLSLSILFSPISSAAPDPLSTYEREVNVHLSGWRHVKYFFDRLMAVPFYVRHWRKIQENSADTLTEKLTNKRLQTIPLHSIRLKHPLQGNPSALKKAKQRIHTLKKAHNKGQLPMGTLIPEVYNLLLPSTENLEVVDAKDGTFITLSGAGRVYALQYYFQADVNQQIEVITYDLDAEGLDVLRRIVRERSKIS